LHIKLPSISSYLLDGFYLLLPCSIPFSQSPDTIIKINLMNYFRHIKLPSILSHPMEGFYHIPRKDVIHVSTAVYSPLARMLSMSPPLCIHPLQGCYPRLHRCVFTQLRTKARRPPAPALFAGGCDVQP